jgi:hypothetical protein
MGLMLIIFAHGEGFGRAVSGWMPDILAPIDMSKSRNSFARPFLTGLSSLLVLIAAGSFFVGGRFIHTKYGTERALAEMEGIGLAVVLGALAAWAKQAGEPSVHEDDDEASGSGDDSANE